MLLLTSPEAGAVSGDALRAAVAVLGQVEVAPVGEEGGLSAALDRRAGRVVAVAGGDGTLHHVVAALRARGELAETVVGLLPLGTGNDFARAVGLPVDDVVAAARVLRDGRPRRLDLLVDDAGGVVVNAAHVGVGAEAARAAGPWKGRLGRLAYPLGGLVAGLRARGWRLAVTVDGRTVARGRLLMVAVGNGSTVGGGTPLLPGAAPDDGRLDVVVSRSLRPLARAAYAVRLRRGAHVAGEDVVAVQGRTVTIRGEPVPVNVDGETGGPVPARTWRVEPAAWRLVVG